jgi:hypothetical protein
MLRAPHAQGNASPTMPSPSAPRGACAKPRGRRDPVVIEPPQSEAVRGHDGWHPHRTARPQPVALCTIRDGAPADGPQSSDHSSWIARVGALIDELEQGDETLVRVVMLLMACEWVEGAAPVGEFLAKRLAAIVQPSGVEKAR